MADPRTSWLLGLAFSIGLASGCVDPPIPPRIKADTTMDAGPAIAPAETPERAPAPARVPASERSPRCVAHCNAQMKKERTSMCRFCRSHQIGVRPENFEAADRACSRTCAQEWSACFDPCEAREANESAPTPPR